MVDRYKARQTGMKILKGTGKAVIDAAVTSVRGLRHVHNQGKVKKYR